MRDDVPAQDMVSCALRSSAIVGSATEMPFWSMKQIRRVTAKVEKTISDWVRGKILVWSWSVFSVLNWSVPMVGCI